MNIADILPYLVFLAVVLIGLGFWLSLPDGIPYAPPQSLIDALPSWLQGPRRRVAAPKESNVHHDMFAQFEDVLSNRGMPMPNEVHEEAAQTNADQCCQGIVHDVPVAHDEVASEVVHDEP